MAQSIDFRGGAVDLTPLTQGKPLQVPAPVGFYLAGECPSCDAPFFHHGATGADEAAAFFTCDCTQPESLELRIPSIYNPVLERMAICKLFAGFHQVIEIANQNDEELNDTLTKNTQLESELDSAYRQIDELGTEMGELEEQLRVCREEI